MTLLRISRIWCKEGHDSIGTSLDHRVGDTGQETPDEQIGDVVQLYQEEYWRQYGKRGTPTTARVKRYNLNGISIAAAVLTDLYPGDHFVCVVDENNLASISLQAGATAMMKMPLATDIKEQMRLLDGQVILFTAVDPQYSQS